MRAMLEASRLLLPLTLALAALEGCGGHGGGSDSPVSPNGDANPAGLWAGGFTAADGVTRSFDVIVAPDGQFVGVVASSGLNGRFLNRQRRYDARQVHRDRNLVRASRRGAAAERPTERRFDRLGRQRRRGPVAEGQLFRSGRVRVVRARIQRSDLARRVAGSDFGVDDVYPPPPVIDTTLVISGSTLTFANDGGCNGAGTIQVIDSAMNIYAWSMLLSACSGAEEDVFSGLATLADNPRRGGTQNLIALYGATENYDRSFVFRGSK